MPEPLYRIGFASCARIYYKDAFSEQPPCKLDKNDFDQPVWGQIAEQHRLRKLDAMLLLGDQVYSDYGVSHDWGGGRPKQWGIARFHDLMYTMYQVQYEAVTGFKTLFESLKRSNTQVGVIWDDHDFGYNNGSGHEPLFKDKLGSTKALFEQFVAALNNPTTTYPTKPDIPAAQPTQGIERITNPIKLQEDVEIVLLDGRFYRSINEGNNGELLGQTQWLKLQNKLETWDPAKLLIVCLGSTYSVGAKSPSDQSWMNRRSGTPYAHFNEFTALAKDKRIIFLSGDIHRNKLIDHGGFCEVISSGAHLPRKRDKPKFGLLDIYSDRVDVKLFEGNQIEKNISKTINRMTGSIQQ